MFWRRNPTQSLVPLLAGFTLLLVTLAATALLVFAERAAAGDVRRSLEIETVLNRIQISITDAETGQRGYLLTGKADYLEPYAAAQRDIPAQVDQFRHDFADSPNDDVLITRLHQLIDEKLTELAQTVALRSSGRIEDALALVNSDLGARTMNEIRAVIDDIRSEQKSGLVRRTEHAARLSTIGQGMVLASVLLAVAVGGVAFRDGRQRIRALTTVNARLEKEAKDRRAAETQVRQLQKMDAIGKLTGGIAHDFNNMLAIIMGSLGMARRRLDGSEKPQVRTAIDNAAEGAKRAAALTARLLAFSRQLPLEPSELDVNRLVGGMSELLRRTISEPVQIETVLAGGLWKVFADPAQLENTLVNLAVNARDAMPDGGRLTIETGNAHLDDRYASAHAEVTAGQYVLISVSDSGAGMSPDVVERAFEPFFTTKRTGEGTGLGLSQVFGYVKQSGGHVKIYSEPGRGTTVKVYLPRHAGAAGVQPAPAGFTQEDVVRGSAEEVVLVVEDEAQVRKLTVESLRDLGYTVLDAPLPSDALRQFHLSPAIKLLFTDVVMPEMTGRELADRLRAERPELKVIYTTGYTRNAIVHNGVLDAGLAFLPKPYTHEQLATKMRQVLDSTG